jgi:hypothetical protein
MSAADVGAEFDGEPDYFCWLLDRVKPWSGGYAVVLQAYFDASRRNGGTFCVAGYAFGDDRAKKATRAWQQLWGETRSHMTDMHNLRGAFKGWDKNQTGRRLQDAVPLINGGASFGVAVSVSMAEFERLAPQTADPGSKALLGGFRTPYGFCCHLAMAAIASLSGGPANDIAHFFESGDDNQFESQEFMARLAANALVARRMYKMRSHAVLSKKDCRLFEMSDILAWEWAKHVERDAEGKGMRGSLTAMLGDDCVQSRPTNLISPTRRGWHITGEPMERYFRRAAEMELLKDAPSAEAVAMMDALLEQRS